MKILIINLGGTSTKVSLMNVAQGSQDAHKLKEGTHGSRSAQDTQAAQCSPQNQNHCVIKETIRHNPAEIAKFNDIWEQYAMRRKGIEDFLVRNNLDASALDLIITRGPSVKPVISGVFEVNANMIRDAKSGQYGIHVSNLGCVIADDLAKAQNEQVMPQKKQTVPQDNTPLSRKPKRVLTAAKISPPSSSVGRKPIRVLTADLPCVDEMIPIARYTGLPQIKRHSFFQALSHKALGRKIATQLGRPYEELSIAITHLGSGISVASHLYGKVIDITNGIGGESPFGMDRPGTLPASDWKKLIQSEDYSKSELDNMLNGKGGLMAHLKTNDALEVEDRIDSGDAHAAEVFEAMAFQVSKALGAASVAMGMRPDAIGITGGLANSNRFISYIKARVSWISPIFVIPDIDEMDALYEAVMPALSDESLIHNYE
ncbi:MAG: butyrate kinase [Clostridiales Family XIII bacterium]|jgi:butyrate kinase|nr:butyrate kinase [Clostridiales Family XIII bacterium]